MVGSEKQVEIPNQIAVQPDLTHVFESLGEEIPDAIQNDLPEQKRTSEESIKNINTQVEDFLLKIVEKSELERLEQQKPLRNWMLFFVAVQLVSFNGVIGYMVYKMCKTLDAQLVSTILDFCKYYVNVVFVELIGMVWFITRSTFTSTSKDIIKGFIDRISKQS